MSTPRLLSWDSPQGRKGDKVDFHLCLSQYGNMCRCDAERQRETVMVEMKMFSFSYVNFIHVCHYRPGLIFSRMASKTVELDKYYFYYTDIHLIAVMLS